MISLKIVIKQFLPSTVFVLISVSVCATEVNLTLRTERSGISRDGRVKLIWSSAGPDSVYHIQQADNSAFNHPKNIYSGPDRASFISGLETGVYYYRIRTDGGHWSGTLTVEVKHHSLQLALILCAMGGAVFLLTAIIVIRGSIKSPHIQS